MTSRLQEEQLEQREQLGQLEQIQDSIMSLTIMLQLLRPKNQLMKTTDSLKLAFLKDLTATLSIQSQLKFQQQPIPPLKRIEIPSHHKTLL